MLDLFIQIEQLLFSAFGSFSLLALRCTASHFHKDPLRRAAHCLYHIRADVQRSDDLPLYGIGDIHIIQPLGKGAFS